MSIETWIFFRFFRSDCQCCSWTLMNNCQHEKLMKSFDFVSNCSKFKRIKSIKACFLCSPIEKKTSSNDFVKLTMQFRKVDFWSKKAPRKSKRAIVWGTRQCRQFSLEERTGIYSGNRLSVGLILINQTSKVKWISIKSNFSSRGKRVLKNDGKKLAQTNCRQYCLDASS